MRETKADWRHLVAAVLLVCAFGALLWRWTLGAPPATPTAPAPKGSNPSYSAPDSP